MRQDRDGKEEDDEVGGDVHAGIEVPEEVLRNAATRIMLFIPEALDGDTS